MESACPEKSFPQLPQSGTHTRRTPTNRAPAKPSPVHTGGTGSPSATAVAPDMPDTPRPCRSSPQAPSDSEGILPPSPHTTYWGYLSQGDTHHSPNRAARLVGVLMRDPPSAVTAAASPPALARERHPNTIVCRRRARARGRQTTGAVASPDPDRSGTTARGCLSRTGGACHGDEGRGWRTGGARHQSGR